MEPASPALSSATGSSFSRLWSHTAPAPQNTPNCLTPPATPSPPKQKKSFMSFKEPSARGLKEMSARHTQRASLSMQRAASAVIGAVRPSERRPSYSPPGTPVPDGASDPSAQSPASHEARRDSMWSSMKRRQSNTPSLRSFRGFVSGSVQDLTNFSRTATDSPAASERPVTSVIPPPQSLPPMAPMSTLAEDMHLLADDPQPRKAIPSTVPVSRENYDAAPNSPIMDRPISRFSAEANGLFATKSRVEESEAPQRRVRFSRDFGSPSSPLSLYAPSFQEAVPDELCLKSSRPTTPTNEEAEHDDTTDHFHNFSFVSRAASTDTVQHAATDSPSGLAITLLPAPTTPSFSTTPSFATPPSLPTTPLAPATPLSARAPHSHARVHSRNLSHGHSRHSSRSYSFPGPSHMHHARHVSSTSTIGSTFSFRSGDSSPRLLEASAVHVQLLPSPRAIDCLPPPRYHSRIDSRSSLRKAYTMDFSDDTDVDATPLASATGTLRGPRRDDFDPDDAAAFALSTGFWDRRPSEPIVAEARLDGPFDPTTGWY